MSFIERFFSIVSFIGGSTVLVSLAAFHLTCYELILSLVFSDWSYSSGFVSAEMISAHLPPPGKTSQILMCGPPPMIKFACLPNLEKLGFSGDMCVPF